jgi:hypothetical protein
MIVETVRRTEFTTPPHAVVVVARRAWSETAPPLIAEGYITIPIIGNTISLERDLYFPCVGFLATRQIAAQATTWMAGLARMGPYLKRTAKLAFAQAPTLPMRPHSG